MGSISHLTSGVNKKTGWGVPGTWGVPGKTLGMTRGPCIDGQTLPYFVFWPVLVFLSSGYLRFIESLIHAVSNIVSVANRFFFFVNNSVNTLKSRSISALAWLFPDVQIHSIPTIPWGPCHPCNR